MSEHNVLIIKDLFLTHVLDCTIIQVTETIGIDKFYEINRSKKKSRHIFESNFH